MCAVRLIVFLSTD